MAPARVRNDEPPFVSDNRSRRYSWYRSCLSRVIYNRRVPPSRKPATIPSQPAVSVFNDLNDYWFNADEHAATGSHVGRYQPGWNSVKVPKTGTQIRVKSVSAQGKLMQVEVSPAK